MDCIAYKDGFTEREYYVMIEHEHNGKSMKEIAVQLNVSQSYISKMYLHAKRRQVELYRQAIYKVTMKPAYSLHNFIFYHNHNKDFAAFLEREHKDILTAYRNGEPESPYTAPKYIFGMCAQSHGDICINKNDITEFCYLTHSIQPFIEPDGSESEQYRRSFRIALYHSEYFVLLEKEKNRKSNKEVGLQFGVSARTVQAIYKGAKLVELQNKIVEICKIADKKPYELIFEMDEIGRYNWKKKNAYLKQSYGYFLSQIPNRIAVYKDEKVEILDCYWNDSAIQEAIKHEIECGNQYKMFYTDDNYNVL